MYTPAVSLFMAERNHHSILVSLPQTSLLFVAIQNAA